MSTDIASLGIQLDSRQVVEGTKALDALGSSSAAVETRVDSASKALGGMSESAANVWRRGGEAAKGVDALGDASAKMGQRLNASNGQMSDTAKLMQMQADQAKAAAQANAGLGDSTSRLTLGQLALTEKFREQAATLGMSRSQLMAYQAAQMGLTTEVAKSIAVFKSQEDAIKAAAAAKAEAEKSANRLAEAIKLLAAGYALLKVGEYVKDAALMAARYETLGVVMEVVGRNAGYTKTQMDYASEGIAKQGITMIESRESAVKLVQAHVDLQHAEGLARIAQNAAVIGHMNSSEAFDRLVNGIARGNVLILRNIGINVNLQSAYREMADSLGKTTKELTENERVEARRIAVFERGADINGVYEKSMDTAGKQILSMQRYTQDFKTTFGETFNEALTIGVMGLTDHLKGSNKAITDLSKNDQLEEWGHNITGVFVGIVTAVSNAVTAMQKVDAFARHMDKRKDIGLSADADLAANIRDSKLTTASGVSTFYQNGKRIDSVRQAALAEENARYEAEQAALSANFGKFERAAAEREKTRTAKRKEEADKRLEVDRKYAADASALLVAAAGKGDAAIAAAGAKVQALHKSVYVGKPDYRDTEGRPPSEKGNDDRSALMQGDLARAKSVLDSEKSIYESRLKMLDKFHGDLGMSDIDFYAGRANARAEYMASEAISYAKELAIVQSYKPKNAEEIAANKNKYDELVKQHRKFTEDMRNTGGEDSAGAAGAEKKAYDEIVKAAHDAGVASITSLDKQIEKQREHNAEIGKTKEQIELARQAQVDATTKQEQSDADYLRDGLAKWDLDDKSRAVFKLRLTDLDEEIARRKELAALLGVGADLEVGTKAASELDKFLDPAKAHAFGDSLRDGFEGAGNSVSKMIQQLDKYGVKSAQIEKQRGNAATAYLNGQITEGKYLDANKELSRQSAIVQVGSYAAATDAAQSFFKQGSKGYEVIGVASKTLHAAEMAMNLASIGPKMAAAAAEFFAQSGWGGFAGVAAMTAVVAGFGVALSGGGGSGGGQTAAEAQKAQGTGTVFGNSDAKSASIARGIELSAANSNIQLNYTAGMLAALKSIDASMSGLANLVAGTSGLTDGSNLGIKTGTTPAISAIVSTSLLGAGAALGMAVAGPIGAVVGAIAGKIASLWGKTTQNIVDSGLQLGGKVSDLQSGKGFNQYASVDTTKSSWFGLSKNTSNSVQTAGLDAGLSSQFGLIFTNLETALKTAAGGLGIGADQVSAALGSLVISTTKVSLKDLKGDDLTAAINGVISATMDTMAAAAIPGLDRFRKVGEGYAETVVRIATDYANVDGILMGIGKTFGWVGIGSVGARERLIELAGGIDELASQTNGFATNFLSKAEQLAPVAKYVSEQLAAMGLAGVQTRDDFKNVVLGLNLTTEAGAQQYASLMSLQEAFAKTHATTKDLTKSEQEIADERADLQTQLDELTMSSAQLLEKQRDALDGSNQALFDQIQVATTAKKAQDDAKTSLGNFLTQMKSFATSVAGFNNSLVLGSLTTLTPEQQLAEARRQFETTRASALGGNATAQGALQGIENTFLTLSQKLNGGDSNYSADLATVMKTNDDLAKWATGQVDVAQASLDALNAQTDGITQLNATMLTVAANSQYLPTLTGNVSAPVFTTVQAPTIDFTSYGNAIAAPLITEIKVLREELKGVRADMKQIAGDGMANDERIGNKVAETIVDGVHDAVTDGVYAADNNTRKPT